MALQPLIKLIVVWSADDEFLAIHRFQRFDFRGQAGSHRNAEFFRELFTKLAVGAERQTGKERRAAEDNRVTIIFDEILDGFFDATELLLEVVIDQLAHLTGGIQDHEAFRKHSIKLVHQSIAPRRSDMTDASAPAVHL